MGFREGRSVLINGEHICSQEWVVVGLYESRSVLRSGSS